MVEGPTTRRELERKVHASPFHGFERRSVIPEPQIRMSCYLHCEYFPETRQVDKMNNSKALYDSIDMKYGVRFSNVSLV